MKHFVLLEKLLLLATFLLFAVGARAQASIDSLVTPKTLADADVEFLSELSLKMTENQPDEIVENFERFQGAFAGGLFTSEEQARILATSRKMKAKRLTVRGHFDPYFEAVVTLKEQSQSAERMDEWLEVYGKLLEDEKLNTSNKLSSFLKFSRDFYKQNAVRFSPNSTSWFAFADSHSWSFFDQPQLKAENVQLTAIRSDDTLSISQTNFTYHPLEEELIGQGGRTTWERTALGSSVFVDLEQYTIDTKTSLYRSPKARLTYPGYFESKQIAGSFSDKLVSDASQTSYPRFDSDDQYLNITNVGDGIRLRGAFRLQGATVYAVGTTRKPAELLVLNDRNQPRFQGEGNLLTVREQNRISGDNVRALIYLGADSLFHPSVNARLDITNRKLRLTRGKSGADRNPFFHSLHRMNIEADYIEAYLETDSLIIGRPTATFSMKDDVIFESLDFFSENDYNQLQNIANANPMVIMKSVARQRGNNYVPAAELANALNPRFTVETIKPLLYELVSKGFIYYDAEEELIQLRDKLFHYVDANQGIADFDYLRLVSNSDSTNASINASIDLASGYTLLEGLENINFSYTQKVGIKPTGKQAYLKGNRNFEFDGELYAGFTVLKGKDFKFDYEDFHVQLDSARYFELYVPTGDYDDKNQPVALSIGSRLEHLRGYLLIDAPNNKSGRKDISIFPSLQSKDTSFVYYDSPEIRSGVYNRDSIFFSVAPFSMDSLDAITAEYLAFKGTLNTNKMFPDIEETLVLQEDQSLGFQHETPPEGYGTYEDRGNYTGEVNLSNQGVEGRGKLEYLAATVNADDFVFMPTKATASADAFDLPEDRDGEVPQPKVHGEVVDIEWRPFADSLIVKSDEAPFELFQANDHQLEGTLVLTPEGLRGSGSLGWSLATANSEIFSFGANSANADTMSIRIKALEIDDKLAVETSNVKGELDFDEGVGRFEANDEAVVTTLPYNQYITTMNEFDWDMNGSKIKFDSEDGKPALFTSIHPDQDSLAFNGEEATYNLSNNLLQIIGVDHIVSADAFIYPDSQYVEISPNAEMAILDSARIVADTLTEYHVINRATVKVQGRREYTASGFYEYNVGPHEQEIELQDIVGRPVGKGSWSEKKSVTRATGEVTEENDFYIDHKTQFQGEIRLDAESPTLEFDGYARINAENLDKPRWFRVAFEGDKNNLVIDYDVPETYDDAPAHTGLFLSKENAFVYTSIMNPLLYRKDRPILGVSKGVFTYLEDEDQFVFGDSSAVIANELLGNKMVFHNSTRKIEAEGRINLGSELRYISVDAAGRLETQLREPEPEPEPETEEEEGGLIMLADDPAEEPETSEEGTEEAPEPEGPAPVTGEFLFGTKLIVPNKLLDIIHNDFKSASFDPRPIGYIADLAFYQKTVQTLFPPSKERDEALSGLGLGSLELPAKSNPYTFLFGKMPMRWHRDYQSFVSTSKENGLISINGKGLNQRVECYVEMKMPSGDGDDRLYLYLKSPSGLFYFFGFKEGIMSITSNNTVYMQELNNIKEKDLIMKMDDGETYEIQAVEPSSANIFYRRIRAVQ